MLPLLLALVPAHACDPAPSDIVQILPADGATDIPADVRFFVRLGDLQVDDDGLDVVVRDTLGREVEVGLTQDVSIDELSPFFDWRLTPTTPLVAGVYTVTVVAPDTQDEPEIATIVVGTGSAAAPTRPAVELLAVEDGDPDDPCFGPRRVLTATVDPLDEADDATLLHVVLHAEGDGPSGTEPARKVLVSPGGRLTLKFNAAQPGDVTNPSCITAFAEGPDGTYSAVSETRCGVPEVESEPEPVEEEPGCGCTSGPVAAWWLALPVLGVARRRS